MSELGTMLKKIRLKQGYSINYFCKKFGIHCTGFNRLEKGLWRIPKVNTLQKYLRYLNVKEGSNLWNHILELAEIERKTPH